MPGKRALSFFVIAGAIIAAAILFLLINLLLCCPYVTDPPPKTSLLVTQLLILAVNSPSELKVSKEVTFRPGASLNAKAITEKTGTLTENQVCVSRGDVPGEELFKLSPNGKILTYQGSSASNFKLYVICERPGNLLDDSLLENIGSDLGGWFKGSVCEGILKPENTGMG